MVVIAIVGALFGTFVLSRILLWVTSRWQGGYLRIAVVHGTLILGSLAGAVFRQHELGGVWSELLLYLAAQSFWLLIDLFGLRGRRAMQQGLA